MLLRLTWLNVFQAMNLLSNLIIEIKAQKCKNPSCLRKYYPLQLFLLSFPMNKIWKQRGKARGYFRLKLSPTSGYCPQWLIFFKNLFYQNNCKDSINIGGGQIRSALSNFFVVKKCPFSGLDKLRAWLRACMQHACK